MLRACPICECPISKGEPVRWSLRVSGEPVTFEIDVCKVDKFLCDTFPTLKTAVSRSETVFQMLRRASGTQDS